MKLDVFPDPDTASRAAAARILALVLERPDALLCAATGASPTLTYRHLASALGERPGAADRLRLLKLDEWGGLATDDPATCEQYLQRQLVGPLGMPPERYVSFRSDAPDPARECGRISRWVAAHGPIDVCVLGLGLNGHLGLNEPGTPPDVTCHAALLTEESLTHPMLEGARSRPACGLTLGLREILASRMILLLVFGAAKAEPFARLLRGEFAADFPASWLRRHAHVHCLADAAATSLLSAAEIAAAVSTSQEDPLTPPEGHVP